MRTAVLRKLFDIRFSYKHFNFSHVCLLVKMASKTVTRSILRSPAYALANYIRLILPQKGVSGRVSSRGKTKNGSARHKGMKYTVT